MCASDNGSGETMLGQVFFVLKDEWNAHFEGWYTHITREYQAFGLILIFKRTYLEAVPLIIPLDLILFARENAKRSSL